MKLLILYLRVPVIMGVDYAESFTLKVLIMPQIHEKTFTHYNRSPKGNMWSAIPVALLCMIVNLCEGKQGSGPEGDEVL